MTKLLYIVIDGLGDLPIPELQNRTPLEVAQTPNLDSLAANGKLGLMYTVERGIAPESDVAVMSILGYDPAMYYTGRGPLEAYGAGLRLRDGDLALRCNFATIDSEGRIVDRRVGRNLTILEANELSRSINSEIRLNTVPSEFEFANTIGHRAVLIIKRIGGLLSGNITNTDPAYTRLKGFGAAEPKLGVETYIEECKPMDDSYESKISAELVNEFTKKTISLLNNHPVNLGRRAVGKLEANVILSRDAGSRLPNLFNINQKYSIDFAWLVEITAKASPIPLSIDCNRLDMFRVGLKAYRDAVGDSQVLINSTNAEDSKLIPLMEMASEYKASIIGVVMDERGSPQDVDRRLELGAKIFGAAIDAGLSTDQIFLDPIAMPLKFMQEQAKNVLNAIQQMTMLSDPPPHISVGLSNISSKATERKLINRTFMVMAMAVGLDAAILDVCDEEMRNAIATAELVMGHEIYSDGYLKAYRQRGAASSAAQA